MAPYDEEALMNEDQAGVGPSTLPEVHLAIGQSGQEEWDDAELVDAWDAAAEEWRLHNPGPGSWLDKATAALALGQPLPGATRGGSKWYTATDSAVPPAATPANGKGSGSKAQKRKRKEARMSAGGGAGTSEMDRAIAAMGYAQEEGGGGGQAEMGTGGKGNTRQIGPQAMPASTNPYLGGPSKRVRMNPNQQQATWNRAEEEYDGPTSPAFAPASPLAPAPSNAQAAYARVRRPPPVPAAEDDAELPNGIDTHDEAVGSGLYPPMGGHGVSGSTAYTVRASGLGAAIGIGKEEASVRAANALYWAGYWQAMSEVLPTAGELAGGQ